MRTGAGGLIAFLTLTGVAQAQPTTCCSSLTETRAQIDRVDKQIVALIAERGTYVRQAARFKRDAAHVEDKARVEEIIAKVRALAAADGAPPDVVEATYRALIAAHTAEERKEVETRTARPTR